MKRYLRPVALAVATMMTASCATIIHPERRGNRGGRVDVVPLVVDILLFIPGLVPGLIAIIVDFGTGAIYTGGGSAEAPEVGRHGAIAIRARDLPPDTAMTLRLLDDKGRVLDEDSTAADDSRVHGRLAVHLDKASRAYRDQHGVPLTLEMQVDDGEPARYPLVMR